jgi:atypical dual specificity phosphatase
MGKEKKPEPKKSNTKSFVVVCSGLPGSGKSTISTQLEKLGWIRVSQDDLGGLAFCKDLFEKSIKKGRSVIVDRCNPNDKERKIWILEAKKAGVEKSETECIYFDVSPEECVKRVKNRKGHPTLSGDNAEEVILSFGSSLKPPTEYETFGQIRTIASDLDSRNVLKDYSEYPISKK